MTKELRDFLNYNIEELIKTEKARKAGKRIDAFTTDTGVSVEVEIHDNGYYYIMTGCRTEIRFFINRLGETIRKPHNSKPIKTEWMGHYRLASY